MSACLAIVNLNNYTSHILADFSFLLVILGSSSSILCFNLSPHSDSSGASMGLLDFLVVPLDL
jgi:hypothetical protein